MARKRTPVTGTHSTDEKVAPDHMNNFNQAIQKALDNMEWPLGEHGATLQLSVSVKVTNPGTIIEYCATFI